MALGETLGYSARLAQNNLAAGLYRNQVNQGAGQVMLVALMGDPALRMHPVAPPAGLTGYVNATGSRLQWTPWCKPVLGYHVYRSGNPAGPFLRVNNELLAGNTFINPSATGGTYIVKAVKLETSASGSYYNPSQGVFLTLTGHFDSDGDGMTDAAETLAGTDPHNPASVLKSISTSVNSGRIVSTVLDLSQLLREKLSSSPEAPDNGYRLHVCQSANHGRQWRGSSQLVVAIASQDQAGFLRVVLIP